jgi:hypothetical protein
VNIYAFFSVLAICVTVVITTALIVAGPSKDNK